MRTETSSSAYADSVCHGHYFCHLRYYAGPKVTDIVLRFILRYVVI